MEHAVVVGAEHEDEIDRALERVVYGAVGITTVVLGRATPGSELTFAPVAGAGGPGAP